MPRPVRAPLPSRHVRGGITWVTALLILLLAATAYVAWMWVPVYWVNLMVRQTVRDYANQAVKNADDAELVEKMTQKLRSLDSLEAPDDEGKVVEVPTVQIDPGAVTWRRDTSGKSATLQVQFQYTRPVVYPLMKRWTQITMTIDMTLDLERADWGPER